jgi:short-subunit dehydrogenase
LINNAGCVYLGALEDLSIEEIKAQFETNFFGTIRVIQAVLPIMINQKSGIIVNLNSIGGRFGYSNGSAYASSKFAIEGLTESLYYEIAPFGIKLILVEPGITNTNIFHSANISKKSNNSDSPYFKEMHRWTNKFTKLIENGSSPNLVAKTIINTVSNNNSKFRYPVGRDAEQALEKRKNMSDEEFFNEIKSTVM